MCKKGTEKNEVIDSNLSTKEEEMSWKDWLFLLEAWIKCNEVSNKYNLRFYEAIYLQLLMVMLVENGFHQRQRGDYSCVPFAMVSPVVI